MVEIVSLGLSSFKISGKEISIVCDPYSDNAVGLKFPKVEANVVTISHDHADHNQRANVRGEFVCFDAPGEYEIRGAEIVGIKSFHDEKQGAERGLNTIFVFEIDDLKLCHLGDLGHDLSSEQIEQIDGIDILFIPVGGHVTIDAKRAARVVAEINPKGVIPIHYRVGKRDDLDPVEVFLKEIGKEPRVLSEVKLKAKDLGENLEVFLMPPKAK
jgi:L-ascorbate metabolism protein UlaG (beta-lactamase superfamily)